MKKVEQLDLTLKYLHFFNVDNKNVTATDIPHTEDFDIPEIEDAFGKLCKLGYAEMGNDGFSCYLTFDGRLFYENTPKYKWFFQNKPFQYENFKKNLQTFWTGLKTFGLIMNALALLLMGYWSLKVSNKTSGLEKELNNHKYINKTLEDSITKSSKNMEKFVINSKAEIQRKNDTLKLYKETLELKDKTIKNLKRKNRTLQ